MLQEALILSSIHQFSVSTTNDNITRVHKELNDILHELKNVIAQKCVYKYIKNCMFLIKRKL